MGKYSVDLSTFKAAGVYIQEIDNSVRTTTTTNSLRLIPGFSNKGPFNRPVYLQTDNDRLSIFGDIDTRLEHKGCYFNRMMRTLLQDGPIIALNLLNVDNTYNGPDQVNFASISLDCATPNPKVSGSRKYGQYDYHANTIDKYIYGTATGDMIPYIGNTPFSSLYDRSRFWIPDKELLTGAAAKSLGTIDFANGAGSYEHTNFLNFANVGTEEFSILVFKPENLLGYDITAETWYGSSENIPFGWIRPSDYISDYFLQVICVKGNWSNYPVLSTDPVWKSYFDKNGIKKASINNFIGAEGITLIGSWIGCIIPDFTDKQGNNLSLESKINARTEMTGLLMSFNEDAAHVVAGDYTGPDNNENDDTFHNDGVFTWGIDIDGDREISSENGEGRAPYIIDMVGHGAFVDSDTSIEDTNKLMYEYLHAATGTYNASGNVNGQSVTTKLAAGLVPNSADEAFLLIDAAEWKTPVTYTCYKKDGKILTDKAQVFKLNADYPHKYTDRATGKVLDPVKDAAKIWSNPTAAVADRLVLPTVVVEENANFLATPIEGLTSESTPKLAPGVYIPRDFLDMSGVVKGCKLSEATASGIIKGRPYYVIDTNGWLTPHVVAASNVKVVYYDVNVDGEAVTSTRDLEDYIVNDDKSKTLMHHTLKIAFNIEDSTFFAYFKYTGKHTATTNQYVIETFAPGVSNVAGVEFTAGQFVVKPDVFTNAECEKFTNKDSVTVVADLMPQAADGCDLGNLHYILRPTKAGSAADLDGNNKPHTIGFLSYAYVEDKDEVDCDKIPSLPIENVHYFNDPLLWDGAAPVTDVNKNMFIVTSPGDAEKNNGWNAINVGMMVRNITYYNNPGEANTYKVIPGITRVIRKQFVNVTNGEIVYNGKAYTYTGDVATAKNGATGFYLYTTVDPVLIEQKVVNDETSGKETKVDYIVRQLPLSDNSISASLRFMPLRGLKITSRHRPGYDKEGTISIEGGIEKIYSVLTDQGIRRGLCNPTMVDYRYIVDSMSYGLESSLGGKVHLSQLAQDRGRCLAVLNMPSAKQFAVSSNPVFCDSYTTGSETRPSFDTKYIPQGGNQEMGSSRLFSLPDENDGSKYAAAFFPNLIYTESGRKISVPPAADACNVLASKFTGVNSPYGICANMNGIIRNRYVAGIEFDADVTDREYLEPFGVNTIIKENGSIMIYGNQTCYQTLKSDMNKLHVRENLNTIEIECNAALKRFNFLYNTPQTRASVVQTLTPILSVMKISGAIDSFNILCDESNNTPEIIEGDYGIVDIDVWFNHGMEKIFTRIKVNRYGSNNSAE